MNLSTVIKKPIITEKAIKNPVPGRYLFSVDTKAAKPQIKAAIALQFGVQPIRINTLIRSGKTRRHPKNRSPRFTQHQKIAIITLPSGQKIDILEIEEPTAADKK